jgi:hypothetical protein
MAGGEAAARHRHTRDRIVRAAAAHLSQTDPCRLDDEELPRLKGIYRRAWVRNNLLVKRAAEIGQALEDASVRALLVEGIRSPSPAQSSLVRMLLGRLAGFIDVNATCG